MRRNILWVMVLPFVLCTAACGGQDGAASPHPAQTITAPAAAPSPSATATAAPVPELAALRRIVLRKTDVQDTVFKPGGQVREAVTTLDTASLDFCGGTFASEQKRVAQYAVQLDGTLDGETSGVLSTAVQYSSEGDAALAVTELQTAVEQCDRRPHPSIFGDDAPVAFDPGQMSDAVPSVPVNHYLVSCRLTLADNSFAHLTLLVTQVGRYVAINSIVRGSSITDNTARTLGVVVGSTTERLRAET